MAHRLTLRRWLYEEEYENIEDCFYRLDGGSVPALCSEFCETEPDGTCPHGFPSILIELGVI